MTLEKLKYPIGKFNVPETITPELLNECIGVIETFPVKLKQEVEKLTDEQLDTPYRPDGWTIRQVVNHCSDSHMNSLMRFKLALTEDRPTIRPYFEDRWAELADSRTMPINAALKILDGIHERWIILLKSLSAKQLNRSFVHPEHGKESTLEETICMYAWHCQHHLAHITNLKKEQAW